MKKKIIAISVVATFVAILCAQSVAAQIIVFIWTDKPQYELGGKGELRISVLNELDKPIEIHNITIWYPWFHYDAEKHEWVGNETLEGEGEPLANLKSEGGDYYHEVEFTIPSDGRAIMGDEATINIWTSEGPISRDIDLSVAGFSMPTSVVDLDVWMTALTVAIVICTIILAIVVFLATRRARVPGASALLPPPRAKAA